MSISVEQLNTELQALSEKKSLDAVHKLIDSLVSLLGVSSLAAPHLLNHPSVQRESSKFVSAPGFKKKAAAYTLSHDLALPIDLKLFWVRKTTKANLSWLVALTPNYEDNTETNKEMNLGIDFVVNEDMSSLYIVLSYNLKLRVLELSESITNTQKEISPIVL